MPAEVDHHALLVEQQVVRNPLDIETLHQVHPLAIREVEMHAREVKPSDGFLPFITTASRAEVDKRDRLAFK